MPVRHALLALACLAATLVVPAAGVARPDGGEDTWEQWRPAFEQDDGSGPVAEGLPGAELPLEDAGDWFDDLETSGDEEPPPTPTPDPAPSARRPSRGTGSGTALRGVRYRTLIVRHARRRGLEPALVAAVIHAESGFRRRAVSRAGARGLMQLMPATARSMGARVDRLFDPSTNIAYGTLYLQKVRAIVGRDVRRIAAAYNAGPGAVRRFGGVPPYEETRTYVRRVVALRASYRRR